MEEAKDAIPRLHLQTLNHYNPALAFIVTSRDLSLSLSMWRWWIIWRWEKAPLIAATKLRVIPTPFECLQSPALQYMMTQLHDSWRLWGTRRRDMPNTRDKILFPSSPPNVIQVKTQDTISELQLPKLMQKITSQTPRPKLQQKGSLVRFPIFTSPHPSNAPRCRAVTAIHHRIFRCLLFLPLSNFKKYWLNITMHPSPFWNFNSGLSPLVFCYHVD